MSEHDQQKMVADWLDANRIKFFAVPNAGRRSPQMAAKLKAEGMKVGIPDLIILTPPPSMAASGVTGAVIEMKQPGRKPTDEQREWLNWFCEQNHWAATACYDAGAAIKWLESLGYGRRLGSRI